MSQVTEHIHNKDRARGFTLVELLMAIAVFVVVGTILVSIASSSSNVWQQGIAHNDRRTVARTVFERMSQDLRDVTQPNDFSMPKLQMVINPTDGNPRLGAGFLLPQAIFWQAPVTTSGTNGDLAAVGYFIQWVGSGNNARPKLCRLYIDPSSPAYTVYSSGTLTWSSTITDTLISGANGAPATQATGYQGQLAENVLGLWVQALDQQLQPIAKDASGVAFSPGQFDSARGYISTAIYSTGTTTSGTIPMSYPGMVSPSGSAVPPFTGGNGALPAALDVAIITVDSRTAMRLTGTEKPTAPTGNFWGDINTFYNQLPASIRRGAEIHSTTINLNSAPR